MRRLRNAIRVKLLAKGRSDRRPVGPQQALYAKNGIKHIEVPFLRVLQQSGAARKTLALCEDDGVAARHALLRVKRNLSGFAVISFGLYISFWCGPKRATISKLL